MRSSLRWVPLLTLAALLLPAAVVAVLGYTSLRRLEEAADLSFREQARDVVTMAAEKIESGLQRAEEATLADLAVAVGRDGPGPAVEGALAGNPGLRQVVLVDRRGQLVHAAPPGPADPGLAGDLLAEIPQSFWERGGWREFLSGDRHVVASIIRGSDGTALLAALVRDPGGLSRTVFAEALAGLEASTCVAVVDQRGEPVYSPRPLDGTERLLTVGFPRRLPGWGLALHQAVGASPRQSMRRQATLFTVAFGTLLAVIAAGVVATSRLVRRETEMARLKADFVANVSHDLKTPLSVIRMFGETLDMGRVTDPATRREYYRVITRESERLSRLIDNVLDFSRIESGHQTYHRVPAAVEPLVRETLEAFAYPLLQQGFSVEVAVAPDLPEALLDPDAVGQALGNLVDNAIKYSGDRKAIRVEAAVVEGRLAVSVADQGIGIPRDEQLRVFEKFYRVGRSETQGRRGSGVGLALVRHVAEAHGGQVTVESEPGRGSRFTLWLPLVDGSPAGAPAAGDAITAREDPCRAS